MTNRKSVILSFIRDLRVPLLGASTQGAIVATTGAYVLQYFVFCRLCTFFPQPPRPCVAPTCHLSTKYIRLYRRTGLAHPYYGRGFVGPKKKTIVGHLVFNPLCSPHLSVLVNRFISMHITTVVEFL
jgi:hypothetical protein